MPEHRSACSDTRLAYPMLHEDCYCSLGDLLRVPAPSLRVLGKTGSWNGRMGYHQTSQMGNSGCRLRGTELHPQASTLKISSPQGTGKEAGAEAERLVPPALIHSL